MTIGMIADAFSMFDYGGRMGFTGLISWFRVGILLILVLMGLDI